MKNENELKLFLITMLLLGFIVVTAISVDVRLKRIEANIEDLRMRVIYGVKP